MDAAFKLAASKESRFRVLRMPLLPLTLGHLFILSDEECAYAVQEKPEFSDLLLACLVCSTPHSESERNLRARGLKPTMRIWAWLARRCNLAVEFVKFQAFWDECHTMPGLTATGRDSREEVGSPLHWRLLAMLMADFHMPRAEALNITVREAICLSAVQAERTGAARISWTPWRERFWQRTQELKAQEAKLREGLN